MNVIFYAGGEPIDVNKLVVSVNDIVTFFNGYVAGFDDNITPEGLAKIIEFRGGHGGVLSNNSYQITKVTANALGVIVSVKLDDVTDMTATIRIEKDLMGAENFIDIFDLEGKYKINQNVELMCDNGSGRELVAIYDFASDMFRVIRNKVILKSLS